VRGSPGGQIGLFVTAAIAVKNGARSRVIIDGQCDSACAIFADIARKHVCITPHAHFGFHKATRFEYSEAHNAYVPGKRFDPPFHSSDVKRWVYARKGFPTHGMLRMSSSQAGRIWKRC